MSNKDNHQQSFIPVDLGEIEMGFSTVIKTIFSFKKYTEKICNSENAIFSTISNQLVDKIYNDAKRVILNSFIVIFYLTMLFSILCNNFVHQRIVLKIILILLFIILAAFKTYLVYESYDSVSGKLCLLHSFYKMDNEQVDKLFKGITDTTGLEIFEEKVEEEETDDV